MRKLFALFLFAVILVCGCASTTPIHYIQTPYDSSLLNKTVYLDSNLSEIQENAIINSLLEWQCATQGRVHFTIKLHSTYIDYASIRVPGISLVILNTSPLRKTVVAADKVLGKHFQYALGLYTLDDGIPEILMVESRINSNDYGIVALHEIGHALGIAHTKEHNAIMHAGVDPDIAHLTKNDLIAFCNLYWCDANNLRICQ